MVDLSSLPPVAATLGGRQSLDASLCPEHAEKVVRLPLLSFGGRQT